ncbi:MAG: thiamine pyrophosphate-binding protein [Pseudomonadota bacterium]
MAKNKSQNTLKNTLTGAEAMVNMLQAHDVSHIFGLCGDTSLPFYDALERFGRPFEHILTRDERHAGYMADGYARVTGKPGICEGPSGGGATYILPALVEANESSIPILAITTDVSTIARGRYPLTELDQPALFAPVTKWNTSLDASARLPAQVRTAFRQMTTGRPGAVHLAFPFDTQKGAVDPQDIWADPAHSIFPAQPAYPDPDTITAIAQRLHTAKAPLVICGGGPVIAGATEELDRFARRLDMPIATTVSGQGALASTHPNVIGVVGTNGGVRATRAVVAKADLVIFIGCRAGSVTTERWRSPSPDTTIIHIDSDPAVLGANYQTEIALCADAALALAALNQELERRTDLPTFGGRAIASKAWQDKKAAFQALAQSDARPIRPERVIACLNEILPHDAMIAADPGTPCPYVSAYYRWQQAGRHLLTNRAHGALGYSLAAAIGAQFGRPASKTVALMGDGSFGFCCGEFETLTRYRLPITSIVFSNQTYGWIKAGQSAGFGKRFYNVDFQETDHAAVAAAFGIKSWRVENPATLRTTLIKAIEHPGPSLVDVISQPLHEAAAPVSEWIA